MVFMAQKKIDGKVRKGGMTTFGKYIMEKAPDTRTFDDLRRQIDGAYKIVSGIKFTVESKDIKGQVDELEKHLADALHNLATIDKLIWRK